MKSQEKLAMPVLCSLPRACPQLITTPIYSRPGSADEVAASLVQNPVAHGVFMAQLAYFRGDMASAARYAVDTLKLDCCTYAKMGLEFILGLTAMYAGDAKAYLLARSELENVACQSENDLELKRFELAALDSGLYDKAAFPEWFKRGCFDPLPIDCYPFARFIYLKYLLLELGDPGMSFMCGPLISQCRAEGALISEIYCRLITSIGFHDRGEFDSATEYIDAAIALALPDKLYAPLAEERNELGLLLDERLNIYDKSAAQAVRELSKTLMTGWPVLCKSIRGVTYARELTAREHHAAKLAIKGLSNAEIARRMGLSVNSVKRYISEAVSKTGAKSRAELADYIAVDGASKP